MKVKENMMERWVAVTKQDANVGDVYYYDSALQMNNFTSKDLNRTLMKFILLTRSVKRH